MKLNKLPVRNIGLKLLSLVIAVIIWLFVAHINNPTRTALFRDVKVKIINADSVTEIGSTFDVVDGESVTIRVTERKNILSLLAKDGSDFEVVADMDSMDTERNTVPLYVTCSNSAVSWDEIDIYPTYMKVKLEKVVTSEFPVSITTSGSASKGYEVGTTELLNDKTIQISGPESLVSKIGKVSATANVSGMTRTEDVTADLKLYDKNGDELSENQISRLQLYAVSGDRIEDYQVSIRVSIWEVFSDIPILVQTEGTPAEGYRTGEISILPVTVNLVGTQEALAELGGQIQLTEPIQVDGATENITETVNLADYFKDYDTIRLADDSDPEIMITVTIERIEDRTFTVPLAELELANKPDNRSLSFYPADAITVKVHSDEKNVYLLPQTEIHCTVDLKECEEPGTYEVPVIIELPEGYQLSEEVSLNVTVSLPENLNETEELTEQKEQDKQKEQSEQKD